MTTTDKDLGNTAVALTHALRKLHKALIDVDTQYFGAVGSPLEHLQLITTHPHFAWLQKLSSLMAELDERLDEEAPFDSATATAFRAAIEGLIGPGREIDPEFRRKYNAMLQDGPEVVMAHAAVRQVLQGMGARESQIH